MEVKTASRLEDDQLPPTIRLIREASNVLGDHTSQPARILFHAHFFTQNVMKQMLLSKKALENSHFLCKVFLTPQAESGISSTFPQAPGFIIPLGCTFHSRFP